MPWQLIYLPKDSTVLIPSPLLRELAVPVVAESPYPTPPELPREWFNVSIDSIEVSDEPSFVQSIFDDGLAPIVSSEPIPHIPPFPFSAISGSFMLSALVLWGLHRAVNATGIKDYVRGMWSMVAFRRWLENREPGFSPAYPILFIAGQLGFCGFLISMPWFQTSPWNRAEFILLLGISCLLFPLLKAGLSAGISKIYGFPDAGILHTQVIYQFHWMLFLGAIPLTVIHLQFPELEPYTLRFAGIWLGISVSVYLLRIITLYFRYISHHLFYLILYLCTLELLPAFWIVMRTGIPG